MLKYLDILLFNHLGSFTEYENECIYPYISKFDNSGIGAREKQRILRHACEEKDKILHRDQDPGQEWRNDGESDHRRTFQVSRRSAKDDHLRQGQRVCLLERNRESLALRYVLCRPVLRMAERNE